MIRLERRPLTLPEIERLKAAAGEGHQAHDAPGAGEGADWVGVTFGGVGGGLLLAGGAPWFVAALAGGFAWRMAVVARRRRGEAAAMFVEASAAVYRRDLQAGQAEVMVVEAQGVVARPELPDQPPAFVFDLGGGELLAVADPALAGPVGDGAFPCDKFELVVAPQSGAVLSLVPAVGASALPPLRSVDFDLHESPQVFAGELSEITDDPED